MSGARFTRAERLAQIQALRAEGLTQREIAAALGVTPSAIAGILYDPDGSKQKARRSRYQGKCEVCGAPTDGSNGRDKAPARCAAHNPTHEADWTRELICEAIRRWTREYGQQPDAGDWRGASRPRGYPTTTWVRERFGSWNAAIAAAGLEPFPPGIKRRDRQRERSAAC